MSEWISVDESLPDQDKNVLIAGDDGVHVGWRVGQNAKHDWLREGDYQNYWVFDVKYWAHIPELPDEKS